MSSFLRHMPTDPRVIAALQQQIVQAGGDVGPTGADGVYGRHTRTAFKHLSHQQRQQFLERAEQNPIDPTATRYAAATPSSAQRRALSVDAAAAPAAPVAPFDLPINLRHMAVFDLKTGTFIMPDGRSFDDVGSGNHAGRNNPALASAHDVGAIPAGLWNVASVTPHTFKLVNGSDTTPAAYLTPAAETNTHGRGGFYIHHRHSVEKGLSASEGCITSTDQEMQQILALRQQGAFTQVYVTADASTDPALNNWRQDSVQIARRGSGLDQNAAIMHKGLTADMPG